MRRLLVAVLVLAALVAAADFGARWYAQRQAVQALAQHLPAGADPSVRVHGFSFLAQALPGRYSHVTIVAHELGSGPLPHLAAQADFYSVTYPLRDAIDQTVDNLTIGRAQLHAVIPGADLASALDVPDLTIAAAGGSGTAIRLQLSVSVAGETIPVMADVTASVTDRTLHLSAAPISAAGVSVPAAVVGELRKRLTTAIPLPGLPFDLTDATVSASDGNLVIRATATDLRAADLHLPATP